ncbi:MAG: phospholipid carrier-dependent glycosyltransferase [Candidatus Lambdaproteobacteria bacterium]|nr:phospholipid carrier-dependent glycosyltransferase [Candidatus Lambdaproteobacteria bacterium]
MTMAPGQRNIEEQATNRAGTLFDVSTRRLFQAAAGAYSLGILWRIYYLFIAHRATDYVYSDMKGYVDRAIRFLDPNSVHSIADTVLPPGMHVYLAALYSIDPTWSTAIFAQFILSALIPIIIGAIAYELLGIRVALLSALISSLYFPFIDYAGYFLSENPDLFAIATSMLLLIRSLRVQRRGLAIALAFAAGLLLGAAASLKSVVLLPAFLIALYLESLAWKYRVRKILPVLVAASLGVLVFLIPLGERCYRLNENRFCLVDNNFGFNVLMGHYGHFRSARWIDETRGMVHGFGSPVSAQRYYQNDVTFNFGVYEASKALAEAWKWTKEHTLDALLLSVEHVFDLFVGSVPWPTSATRFSGLASLYQQIYLVLILLPACIYIWDHAGSVVRLDLSTVGVTLLMLPTIGLMISASMTIGEPRYRIPYDGFTIILAACVYIDRFAIPRSLLTQDEPSAER